MIKKNSFTKALAIVVSLLVLYHAAVYADCGITVSCMMAYDEGGASAVFRSSGCPQWGLSTRNCSFATLQGHREYQEDRVACNFHLKLPFSVDGQAEEISISIAAVLDGHGGDEASEMASTRLVDYFVIHSVFSLSKRALLTSKEHHGSHSLERFGAMEILGWLSMLKSVENSNLKFDASKIRSILLYCSYNSSQKAPAIDHHVLAPALEEALLRTIHDIDSEFSVEAFDKGYISGSTCSVVLLVNSRFLVANIGDSRALLCSQKVVPRQEGSLLPESYAEELTRDHKPDQEDEKARIEAAGGFVLKRGVPRVNGVLAMSRAIGDVYLKRYGVIAEPEITDWRSFAPENSYLVVASDGIFETLSSQNVCDLIYEKLSKNSTEHTSSSSLADSIVINAFRRGSTDNLSAIVISSHDSCIERRCV